MFIKKQKLFDFLRYLFVLVSFSLGAICGDCVDRRYIKRIKEKVSKERLDLLLGVEDNHG